MGNTELFSRRRMAYNDAAPIFDFLSEV